MPTRLIIEGKVQGVGYRYALADEAAALGLAGWVRNRRDGTVEACVDGPPERILTLVEWSKRGPAAARVSNVTTSTADAADISGTQFNIIATC